MVRRDIVLQKCLKIFKISDTFPTEVEYSCLIKRDLHADAYQRHKNITISKLINGLAYKTTKFSLMDRMLGRLKSGRINVYCKICLMRNTVLKIAEKMELFEIQKRQLQYVIGQFSLFNSTQYRPIQEQAQNHCGNKSVSLQ